MTGVGGVSQFNDVIQICLRPTLVAMVTKILEFEHKVSYYTVRMTEKCNILHRTGVI